MVTSLLNELAALPDELALVLDDYHVMESQQVHQAVAFLLDHVPPQLHVVIASRADPPLPLARLRARGQLGELRAADLRFTRQEAAVLLQDVWKLDLPAEAVVALEDRTEGWVAGLQLAALSLQGRAEVAGFIEAFTGTHRFVLDYLSEEVLARQPEQVQTFLLETSVLERVSGPLCDAVTGRADSQRLLEQIERANLFLVPLDEVRGWWRYHHLFADLLCAHLAREQPERLPELHRAAAAWFEQHGLIDEGIRHASAAGDETRAARLVEEQLGERLRRGESVTLTRWLAALPEHTLRSRPRLCLAQALLQWHRYRLDEVERLLEHIEHALDQRPGPGAPGIPTEGGLVADLSAAIALLRAQVAAVRGDPEQTAGLARAALARMTGTESGPRLWARKLLVLADWLRGRMQEAESGYRQVLTEARAAPEPHPMTTSCSALATVQRAQGRLGAALQTYWEALRHATERGRPAPFNTCEAHLGIAQVLYERDQLDDALEHATEAIELSRQVVDAVLQGVALVTLAWTRQAMGDTAAALEAIDQAAAILPAADVALMHPGQAWRARLLLVLGRAEEAARWTEDHALTEEDELTYPRERDYLVLARVLLARTEPARALWLLQRLDTLAESQGRTGSLIEIRALRSLALQAAGDHQGALALLAETLTTARPEGYRRVFADEGPAMAALLRSLIGARQRGRLAADPGPASEHLHRVMRAFRPAREQADTASLVAPALIEPLTARELEVLRLLAAGRRNQEIAAELVVTVETVKKHLTHIFDKLGAANRMQAVAHARELRLLG